MLLDLIIRIVGDFGKEIFNGEVIVKIRGGMNVGENVKVVNIFYFFKKFDFKFLRVDIVEFLGLI